METKACKVCGRELSEADFRPTRWGSRMDVCNECIEATRRETRKQNSTQPGGGKSSPFFDAAFDGLEPREVIDLMSRAKRWLESRGYNITLKGTYTQVREIKF